MSDNPFAPRPDLKVFLDGKIVPVEQATISVFDHGLLNLALCVLGTGEKVMIRQLDKRQRAGIFSHSRHVHYPADINAAMADEDTDPGSLARYVLLRGVLDRLGLGETNFGQF